MEQILMKDIQNELNELFIELFCNEDFLTSNGFLDDIESSLVMGFIVIAKDKTYMQQLFDKFYQNNFNIEITLEEVMQYIYQSKELSKVFNDAVTKYYKELFRKKVDNLSKLNDKPGDIVNIDVKNFDYYNRDKAFLYVDGDIYIGETDETHSDIVSRYFNQDNQLRPDGSNIGKEVIFGHIVNNIAFIDASESINLMNISSEIQNQLNVKKIYLIPLDNETKLVRIAA
jgi:hypothetical protein